MRRLPRLFLAWVLVAVMPWLGGCQSFTSTKHEVKETTPTRKARQAEVSRHIGRERDLAEYRVALSCYEHGDLAGCRTALEPILKRNPDYLEGQLLLAETLSAEGRPTEAIKKLQPLAERQPEQAKLQYALGMLWDATGDTKQALDCYRRATEQEPDNEVYRLSYRTAARAAGLIVPADGSLAGEEPAVAASVELVSHQESSEAAGSATTSDSAGRTDKKTPAAVDPRLTTAMESLRQGASEAALRQFQEVVAAHPDDPQVPISAAVAALQANRPEVAIALAVPALERFPQSGTLYRVLGAAQYRRGDYAASQTALRQALSLDKSSALSYFLMGCTLSKLGQTAEAEEHFRQAQKLDPRFALPRPVRE